MINQKLASKLLYYQKQILILESSIKSLSANKITTTDLKFTIFELKKKINVILQGKINVIKTN